MKGSVFRKKSIQDLIAATSGEKSLKRELGAFDLTLLGIGAIIGTGIFVLTGTGAVTAGPGLTISFVVAALACLFAALSYAEFASSVPVSGSVYTFTYATLGELYFYYRVGFNFRIHAGGKCSVGRLVWLFPIVFIRARHSSSGCFNSGTGRSERHLYPV